MHPPYLNNFLIKVIAKALKYISFTIKMFNNVSESNLIYILISESNSINKSNSIYQIMM